MNGRFEAIEYEIESRGKDDPLRSALAVLLNHLQHLPADSHKRKSFLQNQQIGQIRRENVAKYLYTHGSQKSTKVMADLLIPSSAFHAMIDSGSWFRAIDDRVLLTDEGRRVARAMLQDD